MLDPNRYSLDAATVGFRKRMRQSVNWGNFTEALQVQTESIKVRRELEETPISEVHVMGGQRFGIAGNMKTNEYARQQRQMNGYPLRSFYATGGAIVVPPKYSEGVLATPVNVGLTSYAQYNGVVGNYVSAFTEPLNAPLDSGVMVLARAGVQMKSESISNPYKYLQFQLNMHATQEQIAKNEDQHRQLRGYNRAGDMRDALQAENDGVAALNNQYRTTMNQDAYHQAEVPHQPGASEAVLGNLPNIHAEPTQNATLLAAETGEEIGDFEGQAQEETKEGREQPTAMQMLQDMDANDRHYLMQVLREPGGAQIQFDLNTAGDDEERQDILFHIRQAEIAGLDPARTAHIYANQGRRQLLGVELNRHLAEVAHVDPHVNEPSVTTGYTTAPPALEQASQIANNAFGSPGLTDLLARSKKFLGRHAGRVAPVGVVVDGLAPVERLTVEQARMDNQERHGENALEFNEGEMKSDPDYSRAAIRAFLGANANESPGFGLVTSPQNPMTIASRRTSGATDTEDSPLVRVKRGERVKIPGFMQETKSSNLRKSKK